MPPVSPKKNLKPRGVGKAALKKPSTKAKESQRAIDGLTRPAIKRMAKKGGVKCMKSDVFEYTKDLCQEFVRKILDNALIIADFQGKSGIKKNHLIQALRMHKIGVIGFGAQTPKCRAISF